MHRLKAIPFLFFILICLSPVRAVNAQMDVTPLRPGQTVERTITRGKVQSFNLSLEREQFLQLVVEQRGIDVVVRVFSPGGKSLGDFDSPNGTDGPENVALVADESGVYRIDVLPLEIQENTASGRYEIKVLDLRAATKEELESIKKQEAAKTRGVALLAEVAASLQLIRLPETRVRLQMQVAQLLWDSDEKLAAKLVDEAIAGVKEYLADIDTNDQNYYQSYQNAMQLRNEVLMILSPRNPELALSFLRSTRTLTDPYVGQGGGQPNQELQLELSIASQVAAKNSKLALRIAGESLKKGYSYNFVDILMRLQATDRKAAATLAGELADRLQTENLLKNQEAANLALNLLQIAKPTAANNQTPTADAVDEKTGLLPEQKYRDLFAKALSAALSYDPPAIATYSTERNSAQNLLNTLKSLTPEMEKYAPGRITLVEKRSTELNLPPDPQSRLWQKYQEKIQSASLDDALEDINQAPQELREQLFQQLAQKAVQSGESARARQILNEYLKNPYQRQQALMNLERQAVYQAINSKNIEEALRIVNNLRKPTERASMLIQIVNQVGATQKRAVSLEILEQARRIIGLSGRADDQEQMNVLFELARAYLRLEPKRSSEIIEPLVDQFNDLSIAAVPLNGFGQQYFRDGELMMQNGNNLGAIANQLIQTLGALAVADFDRAKAAADKMQRTEVRLSAYLAMAQQAIGSQANGRGIDRVISSYQYGRWR